MPAKDRESGNRQDARIRDYLYAILFISFWTFKFLLRVKKK